jgi:pimeloyl-ACP methyl ester carboxylesterase
MHLHVNGVDLEYVDVGSGVPVVFIHGGSSDVRFWAPQRDAFAARHRFVAYSQRGRGSSTRSPGVEDTAEAHADDAVALIEHLGAGPVHLVGFSSAVALRATLKAPALIRSLTAIEPNVPWLLQGDADGEAVLADWRDANRRLEIEAGGDARRRAELWFELVNNRGPGTFDRQHLAFRTMWLENFGSGRAGASAPLPITCSQLSTLSVPALALGTEHGMRYSRAILDRLVACLPSGERVVVPGVTHFVSYQAPDAFNAALLEFISFV